jgi:4-phospho-D-threonate 3-dehydrogenase / 4-phospho-D-erythronate 3-dehydrogenase
MWILEYFFILGFLALVPLLLLGPLLLSGASRASLRRSAYEQLASDFGGSMHCITWFHPRVTFPYRSTNVLVGVFPQGPHPGCRGPITQLQIDWPDARLHICIDTPPRISTLTGDDRLYQWQTGHAEFDERYSIRTSDPAATAALLTEAVQQWAQRLQCWPQPSPLMIEVHRGVFQIAKAADIRQTMELQDFVRTGLELYEQACWASAKPSSFWTISPPHRWNIWSVRSAETRSVTTWCSAGAARRRITGSAGCMRANVRRLAAARRDSTNRAALAGFSAPNPAAPKPRRDRPRVGGAMFVHTRSPGMPNSPRIAVTMGDPAGVGPEICLHLLGRADLGEHCLPIVFGDAGILRRVAETIDRPGRWLVVPLADWPAVARELTESAVVDCGGLTAEDVQPGRVSAATGAASYGYIRAAIRAALAGEVAAVATGPIHKEALRAAGISHPGHTEIFAEQTGAARICMMLTAPEITCSLVTTHVGYHQVPELLSVERILEVIELTADAMQRLRGRPPRLVVCGLNPHAGEHGLFGRGEEERLIAPAIDAARSRGIEVIGPLPPDTAFVPARRRQTEAFVCMYHDQGLIPLKALAFDQAVNVTLGLPIIRTSVDHGTALDIAWQGVADPGSMIEAVLLAARMATAHTN